MQLNKRLSHRIVGDFRQIKQNFCLDMTLYDLKVTDAYLRIATRETAPARLQVKGRQKCLCSK